MLTLKEEERSIIAVKNIDQSVLSKKDVRVIHTTNESQCITRPNI